MNAPRADSTPDQRAVTVKINGLPKASGEASFRQAECQRHTRKPCHAKSQTRSEDGQDAS